MDSDRMLTVAEAARLLLSTPENVRRMVRSGRLEGEPAEAANDYRIRERDVRRLIEEGGYVPGITQPGE